MPSEPRILMLATDIMFSSNVSGFAADRGVRFRRVESTDELQEDLKSECPTLLVVDLGVADFDAATFFSELTPEQKRDTVAFAPHVHVQKLEIARQAGVGSVMSRGQFSSMTGRIVHGFKDRFEAGQPEA